MNGWFKRWALPGLAGVILLAGIGLQVAVSLRPPPEGGLSHPLKEAIPAEIPGWQVKDLDLGPTESVTQRSHSLLKLDDFVHRQYQRGGLSFTVYVAYWKPGKMPVRLVNQHTPDRCWTEVGFTCTDRKWNLHYTVGGRDLLPAQWGIYELEDFRNYTYFWHIVGNEAHWYGGERINTKSSLTSVWEDFRKFGLNVHREQFFVRIVSAEPMDDLWQEEAFQTVLASLADLCLAAPGPGQAATAK